MVKRNAFGDKVFHREDGPARIWPNGRKEWYIDGYPHRDGGPAIEYENGAQKWCRHGRAHRADGPAFIDQVGRTFWFLNGNLISWDEVVSKLHNPGYEPTPFETIMIEYHLTFNCRAP